MMSQFEIRGKYPLWVKKVKALDEWQKLMVIITITVQ